MTTRNWSFSILGEAKRQRSLVRVDIQLYVWVTFCSVPTSVISTACSSYSHYGAEVGQTDAALVGC